MSHFAAFLSLRHTLERINYFTKVSSLPPFPLIDSLHDELTSLRDVLNPDEAAVNYRDQNALNEELRDLVSRFQDFFNLRESLRGRDLSDELKQQLWELEDDLHPKGLKKSLNGRNWSALDEELREVICKLEDVLESQLSTLLLSHDTDNICIDSAKIEQEIRIFIARVSRIRTTYSRGKWAREQVAASSSYAPPTSSSSSSDYSSRSWFFAEDSSKLVGIRDEVDELKRRLLSNERERRVIVISGMAGIGKTAFAKAACEDPQVWNHFDYRIFVSVGPDYQLREVLFCVLSQLNHGIDDDDDDDGGGKKRIDDEKTLAECVFMFLRDKRYIILLDDIWDEDIVTSFRSFLPENLHGSRMILTTRLRMGQRQHRLEKRFLDKEESWDLLRKKVFDKDPCPYELKKPGNKIAEKCEGLPLAIICVGNHLSKAEKTVEYWESIAEIGIANIISADGEVFKVLHPSYQYMSLRLKSLFLYFGVFPEGCEISASRIAKLWIAEGFLDANYSGHDAHVYLKWIRAHNLVVVKQERSLDFTSSIKSCSLHIVYWCYCKIQARKEKLFQILTTINDGLIEGTESQRRLCIHNHTLFGIKESHDSIASISNLRSILCTGPYHKYPIPVSLGPLKLLRVFDAVAIRFYEFPFEVLDLVLLRYLAFTFDGNLPQSISRLVTLEVLIVHRHVRVIDPNCPSYLPSEIWNMKELRHLQVVGSDLPEPPHHASELPNLLKLLDVTPLSCTKNVLEKIPILKKLGVQIVLSKRISLDHLKELYYLESLKCVVVNPNPSSVVTANAYPTSIFPEGLQKLALSGFGYPWDQMSNLSRLSCLEVLKLRHCAFRGSTWNVRGDEFKYLRFLLLEGIDLRHWRTDPYSFNWLERLVIRHCYKLEGIITTRSYSLKAIEIVDCKPCVGDFAKRLDTKNKPYGPKASVISSWED